MDKKKIYSLLDLLTNYLQELEEHLPKTIGEYNKNIEKQRFCERTLQLLIEICIDVSYIIVKELKIGLPEEEESVFDRLSEKSIVSEEIYEKLKEMKKFRNILIHKYKMIDNSKVYLNATKHRHDFEEFKNEILAFLKKEK